MINLTSPIAVVMFATMMALAPLASAMYLPAFPAMTQAFGVGADQVQLTLSAYMVGMAVSQLVYGPLADRYGRKPLILAGTTLFAVASLGCMLAGDIRTVIVFRFLQAFGASAGLALSQAMVRDTFAPVDAARTLAYIGGVQAVAPAIGPVLGGLLLVQLGWRSIFAFFTVCAVVVVIAVAAALPESLTRDRRQALHPRTILRNYRSVPGNRIFLSHALALALQMGGFYAFMSGGPFVLINLLGVPEDRFGWYYLLIVVAFIVGSIFAARLGRRFGGRALIVIGGCLLILGGALMVALELMGAHSVAAILGPQAIYAAGSGVMMAQLITGALMPFPRIAATAAASMGFIQMSCAAATSALVGRIYNGTALPMALTIALAGTASLVVYLALSRSPAAADARVRPAACNPEE